MRPCTVQCHATPRTGIFQSSLVGRRLSESGVCAHGLAPPCVYGMGVSSVDFSPPSSSWPPPSSQAKPTRPAPKPISCVETHGSAVLMRLRFSYGNLTISGGFSDTLKESGSFWRECSRGMVADTKYRVAGKCPPFDVLREVGGKRSAKNEMLIKN